MITAKGKRINIFKLKKQGKPAPTQQGPKSPYLAAREEWLERYGDYIHREAMWRYAFFACAVLAMLAFVAVAALISQQKVVPYIVQVDGQGKTAGIQRLDTPNTLPKEFIQAELAGFIQNWRTVTADFDLQKRMIDKLASFSAGAAKGQLKEWYEQNNPYATAKSGKLVQIDIKGLPLPVSKDSWRVEWLETTRSHTGLLLNTETYAATLSVKIQAPQNEAQIMHNPGGVMVTEISTTKVLN